MKTNSPQGHARSERTNQKYKCPIGGSGLVCGVVQKKWEEKKDKTQNKRGNTSRAPIQLASLFLPPYFFPKTLLDLLSPPSTFRSTGIFLLPYAKRILGKFV